MKKKFRIFIIFLLVFCLASCSSGEKLIPFEDNLSSYDNSVGYVLSYDRTGRIVTGYSSAFVYSKNDEATFIVTGNKIIKNEYTYKFVIEDNFIECEVIGSDSKLNLAVLSFDSDEYNAKPLARKKEANLSVGNTIYVDMLSKYSSKLEEYLSISKGMISQENVTLCTNDYLLNCNNYMLIDNASYEEAIGAPVFDYFGNLSGVVSYIGYAKYNNVLSYVSKIEDVVFSVDNILKGNKTFKEDLHIEVKSYEDLKDDEKSQVALSNIKSVDVIITNVTGVSQSNGVEKFAKLVSVDGVEIINKTELVSLMSKYRRNDIVKIVVEIEDEVFKTYSIRL